MGEVPSSYLAFVLLTLCGLLACSGPGPSSGQTDPDSSLSHQGQLPPPRLDSMGTFGDTSRFWVIYLEGSESTNRTSLVGWLRDRIQRLTQNEDSFLVYWSNGSHPLLAKDTSEIRPIIRAMSQEIPALPKPYLEADRLLQSLAPSLQEFEGTEIQIDAFVSLSFFELSAKPFFQTILPVIQVGDVPVSLSLTSEERLPHLAYLDSLGLFRLTYDNLPTL